MIPSGPVLGVDPGGKSTGLAVRHGAELLEHATVTRAADEDTVRGIGVGPAYLTAVLRRVAELLEAHGCRLIAVEGVTKPNPHVTRRNGKSLTDPTGILGAAMVLGAVIGAHPEAVIVPPGGNGSRVLALYPLELVGSREAAAGRNRIGMGQLRHARSAFDVAGQAGVHARLRAGKHAITRPTVLYSPGSSISPAVTAAPPRKATP